MFVFSAATMLEELQRHTPALMGDIRDIANLHRPTAMEYAALPALPIDKAVMEKTTRLALLPARFDWADLGTMEAVERIKASGTEKS